MTCDRTITVDVFFLLWFFFHCYESFYCCHSLHYDESMSLVCTHIWLFVVEKHRYKNPRLTDQYFFFFLLNLLYSKTNRNLSITLYLNACVLMKERTNFRVSRISSFLCGSTSWDINCVIGFPNCVTSKYWFIQDCVARSRNGTCEV